ncbi:MAG TPA: hypothetical protein VND64_13610 [Pirellulales bacterium]|nr:hypothetical protein [Pirellulales bacterium]
MELVAESLSALMVSLDEVGIREADVNAAHGLLRHWTKCERVFLSRYMSKDEPADPNGFRDAGDRLSYLESCVQVAQRRESQRGELIDEAQDIVRSVLSPEVSDVAPVLERLEFVVAALVGLGVGPRDAKLRKVVKPLCEHDLPEYIGDLLKAALEAARTRAATDTIGADTALKRKWSDKVNEVRLIFNGKRVILVGGEPRAEATAKMADAFQCTVQHETPAAHSSLDYLEDAIRHRDTAVVLLLIKLSSKGYGPQLQQLCRRAGIPLVRLKAGYGVERIAAEVLAQAGKRLSAKKV